MRLPSQKKILREDLKDAPDWVSGIINPVNNFMESVYQALNKNITFSENIASFVKEISYKTPSTYPTVANVEFASQLRTKAIGVEVLQAFDKDNYTPAAGPVYVPWVEENGVIVIGSITGLQANKTYLIRLLVS